MYLKTVYIYIYIYIYIYSNKQDQNNNNPALKDSVNPCYSHQEETNELPEDREK